MAETNPQIREQPDMDRRTMRYWLSREVRQLREDRGFSQRQVANLAGVDGVSRFENNKSWPNEVDRIVAAYAQLAGIEDGRDLWLKAARAWKKKGGVPVIGELTPQQRSLRLALEASQHQGRDDDESQ